MRSFVWDGEITAQRVRELIPRAAVSIDSVAPSVQKLIAEVQAEGAAALARHAQEFDGVVPNSFRVPISAIKASEADLPDGLRVRLTSLMGSGMQLPSQLPGCERFPRQLFLGPFL